MTIHTITYDRMTLADLIVTASGLEVEAEEFEGPDGTMMAVDLTYWHPFAEALDVARKALEAAATQSNHIEDNLEMVSDEDLYQAMAAHAQVDKKTGLCSFDHDALIAGARAVLQRFGQPLIAADAIREKMRDAESGLALQNAFDRGVWFGQHHSKPDVSAGPHSIGYIECEDGCHPRAILTHGYAPDGNVWPAGTRIYAAPVAAQTASIYAVVRRKPTAADVESMAETLPEDTYVADVWDEVIQRGEVPPPVAVQPAASADSPRVVAYRETTDDGDPMTDWIDGDPGDDATPSWNGGRIERAYAAPTIKKSLQVASTVKESLTVAQDGADRSHPSEPGTRTETPSEHIARDMREGRFPERSEPMTVNAADQPSGSSGELPKDPRLSSQFAGDVRRLMHMATEGAQRDGHPDHYQYKLCVLRIREALEWTR